MKKFVFILLCLFVALSTMMLSCTSPKWKWEGSVYPPIVEAIKKTKGKTGKKMMEKRNAYIKELKITDIAEISTSSGHFSYQFKQGLTRVLPHFNTDSLFTNYRHLLGLRGIDSMAIVREFDEYKGKGKIAHYHQYYKGLLVEDAFLKIEHTNKAIKTVSGNLILNIDMEVNPQISKEEAIEIAMKSFPDSVVFPWEKWDFSTTQLSSTDSLSFFPSAKLLLVGGRYGNPQLAYEVNLTTSEPYDAFSIYINAESPPYNIVKKISNMNYLSDN
ncbi:MAG: PepSY domain-containing protein [Chitinophagales bacterium]